MERVADNGGIVPLDETLLSEVDTVVVISFDSRRTGQAAAVSEIQAVTNFLSDPNHVIAICPITTLVRLLGRRPIRVTNCERPSISTMVIKRFLPAKDLAVLLARYWTALACRR